jgi:hypothetical protein
MVPNLTSKLKCTTKEENRMVTMPQTGKNKGNKNAALKPGQLGRVQWTQVLSGDNLVGFVQYLGLEPDTMTKEELRDRVAEEGRKVFESALKRLLEGQHGSTTINQ